MDNNIPWNSGVEKILSNIMDTIAVYKNIHANNAAKCVNVFNILTIMGICLGPVSGILSAIDIVSESTEVIFPIIISISGFLSGVIVSMIKFGKFDEQAIKHKEAFSKYNSLEKNILLTLSINREYRKSSPISYLEETENNFSSIFMSAPILEKNAIVKMTNTMCRSNSGFVLRKKSVDIEKGGVDTEVISNDDDNSLLPNFDVLPSRRYSIDTKIIENPVIIYEMERLKNNSL